MMINLLTAFLIGLFFFTALAGFFFLLWRLSGALDEHIMKGGFAATAKAVGWTAATCAYIGLATLLIRQI